MPESPKTERKPNAEQAEVIENFTDNALLFASAGTGKTFTVSQKIRRAIEKGFCKSEQILALTFTVKACNQLKEDIARYADGGIAVKTIHGFCLYAVREEAKFRRDEYALANVIDESDVEEILTDIIVNYLELGDGQGFPIFKTRSYYNFASLLKHARYSYGYFSDDITDDYKKTFLRLLSDNPQEIARTLSDYKGVVDTDFIGCMKTRAGEFMAEYERRTRAASSLDFDDLIIKADRIFSSAESAERWKDRYKLIIVDEVQDTSAFEYRTLKKLFGGLVLLCGDLSQTIYEWRGSSPQFITDDFLKNFGAKIYYLTENYRSTRTLTRAGFGYLKKAGAGGKYLPENLKINSSDDGGPITVKPCETLFEEGEWIYSELKKMTAEERLCSCVICRSNFSAAKLERVLTAISKNDKTGLRFFTLDKDFRFFKRPVSKDILAFLKVVSGAEELNSLHRIALRFVRGVGEGYLAKIQSAAGTGVDLSAYINPATYEAGDPYADLISSAKEGNLFVYDLETTGLDTDSDEIIQIAAARINQRGEILGKFNRLVLPAVEISPEATKTHGYTYEKLIEGGAVAPAEALQSFAEFVGNGTLIGYNNKSFDDRLLFRQLARFNKVFEPKNSYDALRISKIFLPFLPNYKLSTLCERFGIVNLRAHDAYYDVAATAEVTAKLLDGFVIPNEAGRRLLISGTAEKFSKLYFAFKSFRKIYKDGSPSELLSSIISTCNIRKIYKTELDDRTISDFEDVFENGGLPTDVFVRKFIDDAAMSGGQIDLILKRLNKIPVVTVHQTKGCEFDTVFLADADDRNFPNIYAEAAGGGEEEKRLFYVALTRARLRLYISYYLYGDDGRTRKPSPYLELIPQDCVVTE